MWLPPATSATDKQWRQFGRGRHGVPSLKVIKRHGGLGELLRQACLPNWREQAEEWDRNAIPAPVRGRPRSNKAERLGVVIRERGEASARDLAEALDYDLGNVRYHLRQLKEAGRIETVHPHAQARNQRYRLI
jgi:DNA-binding transcriptional ArsR family regulator